MQTLMSKWTEFDVKNGPSFTSKYAEFLNYTGVDPKYNYSSKEMIGMA